jgi:hypothetical protein
VVDDFRAVQEVDRHAGRQGEDPGGADRDGRVQLSAKRDAFHGVNNGLKFTLLKASSLGLFYRRKQIDQATEII